MILEKFAASATKNSPSCATGAPRRSTTLALSLDARRTSTLWECSIRLVYKTNCPSPLANWTKSTCIVSVDFVPARIPGQWLIDSGNHYTSARHILSSFRDILPVRILTGNGHVTALGSGVTLHTSLGTRLLTGHWYGILQTLRVMTLLDSALATTSLLSLILALIYLGTSILPSWTARLLAVPPAVTYFSTMVRSYHGNPRSKVWLHCRPLKLNNRRNGCGKRITVAISWIILKLPHSC